jgi:hypothetical protein
MELKSNGRERYHSLAPANLTRLRDHDTSDHRATNDAAQVWLGWKREAEKLLRRFWLTGRIGHLAAFCIHVIGMRARILGPSMMGPYRRFIRQCQTHFLGNPKG